jgi:sugar-phosphatase
MDGLIVDSEPLWHQAQTEILGECGVTVTDEDAAQTLGVRIDHVIDYFYQRSPWEGRTKAEVIDAIISRVMQLVRKHQPMMPGVLEAIALFRSQGLLLGVASSSPLDMIKYVLEELELNEYFQVVCSAGDLEYPKPHPEVYINAANVLQVDEAECLALEDSFSGLLAAKAARMKAIAIPEASTAHHEKWAIADRQLSSLLDLTRNTLNELQD